MDTQISTTTKTISNTKLAVATLIMLGAGSFALATIPFSNKVSKSKNLVVSVVDVEAVGITFENKSFPEGVGWESTGIYRNNGNTDTGPFVVSVYHEDSSGELHLLFTKNVTNLKPGEQQTVVEQTISKDYVFYAYLLKVDSNDVLKEKTEDNNMYWIGTVAKFSPGSKTDFGVRNLKISKAKSNQAQVTFDVVNYGLSDLSKDVDVNLERKTTSGGYLGALLSTWIQTLKAGRQTTITQTMSITPPTGFTNNLRATVDVLKQTDDVSWSNNTLTLP